MRRRLLIAVVLGVLVVQITVPLAQLFRGDPPARFGWQMYSASPEWPTITVVDSYGDVTSLDESDIHVTRKDMRADERLAGVLCDTDPERTRIQLHYENDVHEFDCPPS